MLPEQGLLVFHHFVAFKVNGNEDWSYATPVRKILDTPIDTQYHCFGSPMIPVPVQHVSVRRRWCTTAPGW